MKFFKSLITIGILLIIGTAGASDFDAITLSNILHQFALSLSLIAIGCVGIKIIKLFRLFSIRSKNHGRKAMRKRFILDA